MPSPPLTPLAAAVLRIDRPPERVLEIDCGDAEGTLFLAREFPAARVRGIDGSEARVRAAKARVGLDPEGRVAFKAGRASSIPYPDGLFDLVVTVDARPVPAEVARVLKPGGHLILAFTGLSRPISRASRWWLRRRLARRGIEVVEAAEAGDGDFYVARARDGDRSGVSI
jgi:ubiquinone/menaquinone biosynthesis C-methylase UbiE